MINNAILVSEKIMSTMGEISVAGVIVCVIILATSLFYIAYRKIAITGTGLCIALAGYMTSLSCLMGYVSANVLDEVCINNTIKALLLLGVFVLPLLVALKINDLIEKKREA